MEQRFKNEFYTVIRTMQNLLAGYKNEQFDIGNSNLYQDDRLAKLKYLQQFINLKYENVDKSHLL